MKNIGYILVITVMLLSCKTQKLSSSSVEEETKLAVSYTQTAENGNNNPDFKIELYSNRQMYLTANKNLDKEGKYLRTISEKEYNQIVKSFTDAGFFKFNNEYFVTESTEPLKQLYFKLGKNEKEVKLNEGGPESLHELEFLMRSYLDRVGWEKMSW